jgi:hypothetical protein
MISMSFLLSAFMTVYLRAENRRRDRRAEETHINGYTAEQKYEERERGDYASFFRYTL